MRIDSYSFLSLVETREVLEISSVSYACERHTQEDIVQLETSLNNYLVKAEKHISAVEEDLMFHLTIADLGKNKVLKSMLLIIIPDIISNYNIFNVCETVTNKALEEHCILFNQIKNRDSQGAAIIMKEHLKGVMNFAKSIAQ